MDKKLFVGYESPEMEMLEMSVECGFAGSIEDGGSEGTGEEEL